MELELKPTRSPYDAKGSTVCALGAVLGHLAFALHTQFGPSDFQGQLGEGRLWIAPPRASFPFYPLSRHHAQGQATPCPGIGEATISSVEKAWFGLDLTDPRECGPLRSQGLTVVPYAVIKAQPLLGKQGQQLTACYRVPKVPTLRCPGHGTFLNRNRQASLSQMLF